MSYPHEPQAAREPSRRQSVVGVAFLVLFGIGTAALLASCGDSTRATNPGGRPVALDPALVATGKDVFRFNTFGDEVYWTDTLRMHEVVESGVSPATALAVGLKVDADTLPAAVKSAIAAGAVDLNDPATTVALLKLGAVVGLRGTVETVNGRDTLTKLGVTCALCHSTVDNSFAPGIGHRLDGAPNHDLNVGAIVALSPAVPAALKAILNSWGPGMYDARTNFDGKNGPALIPPAYGLNGVAKEIYTGDDTISYWNAYVAVTQMHGQGNFHDARLNINVSHTPDLVTPLLPALREYQLSLAAPKPAVGSFDAAAATRGKVVFNGAGRCANCHLGTLFTDVNLGVLHAPAEVGQDAAFAQRSVTGKYRTTPLRGLAQHAPYFHDGAAKTLLAVVQHYDTLMNLHLTPAQMSDLVEYLKTL
jgi:hypothetical protein